jgi:predicted transcriptional regulator YdeE
MAGVRKSMNRPHMAIRATFAVLSVFVLSTLCLTVSGSSMPPKIVEEKGFTLIGIAARTNNAKEMTDGGVIPAQWNKFFSEGTLAKIPNKVDTNICAVYTDYASDRNGDYTYFIGAKVSDATAIPTGMVMKTVPAGKYSVVTSAKGPVQEVVPLAWRQVWTLDDHSQLGGTRSYKADFEVYDDRSRDPRDSQVDLYIGIK